ncbi:MAG: hypothetical protein ACRYFR_04870 [Janthinobacterium lividum]
MDLDFQTALLPTFQANDRTKPASIQSDYSPEFSAPGTARNHRLLGQAALNSTTTGTAYRTLPAVLSSGGVETLPLASLILKGYAEGRYQLQLVGGNRRLVEALGDKKLADLKLDRFNHAWTPQNVALNLPYAQWLANGWGYEVYDRGKPLDLTALDPYALFPSTSDRLVWQQLLADAGFTADELSQDPLAAALNVPTTKPFGYDEDFRETRHLLAGIIWSQAAVYHYDAFAVVGPFRYAENAPWVRGEKVALHDQEGYQYVVPTMGYYRLKATLGVEFGVNAAFPGRARMALALRINGQEFTYLDANGETAFAHEEQETGKEYLRTSLTATCPKVLLHVGDVVDTYVRGQKINRGPFAPTDPHWFFVNADQGYFMNTDGTVNGASFEVELLPDFPPGGTIRLQDWLPEMKQLDYLKTRLALLGLTVQTDPYRNHLYLATGAQVLAAVAGAPDWSAKRDAYAPAPAAVPERSLSFRFGDYARRNLLSWAADDLAAAVGLGNGEIAIADQALSPAPYEMVTLPFAASENSLKKTGLLLIPNYKANGIVAPVTYAEQDPKPRLTLRRPGPQLAGQLVTVPATETVAAVTVPVTTSASYFIDGLEFVDLDLQRTVLNRYWPDLRALLLETRALTERYRLSPADIASLRFAQPIYDAALGGYFVVSKVSEYDARRSVEVELARLNPLILPAPDAVEGGKEFYSEEFNTASEFY